MDALPSTIVLRAASALLAATLATADCAAAFELVPGHIYTSDWMTNTIIQTGPDGNETSTLTLSDYSMGTKGLAFAADDTLYVVAVTSYGHDLLRLGRTGKILAKYPAAVYVTGNISDGKIAISPGGRMYMANGQLMSLAPGVSPPTVIYTDNQVYDVDFLPSGNLLVVTAYRVVELTSNGVFVRDVLPANTMADGRGIKYERSTRTFVTTMLGYTNHYFELRRWDLATGAFLGWNVYGYGDDIDRFPDGRLLVGSRTNPPGVFDAQLGMMQPLHSAPRLFVAIHSNPIFSSGFE